MDTNFASLFLLTQVRMPVFSRLFPSKILFRVVRVNGLVGNLSARLRRRLCCFVAGFYVRDCLLPHLQLMHPFLKAAAAVKGSRENGGSSVVNISSVAGLTAIKSGTPVSVALNVSNCRNNSRVSHIDAAVFWRIYAVLSLAGLQTESEHSRSVSPAFRLYANSHVKAGRSMTHAL